MQCFEQLYYYKHAVLGLYVKAHCFKLHNVYTSIEGIYVN